MSEFVQDIWYFAGLSGDVKPGGLTRIEIAGEPITLGRKRDGSIFALRDICPHRAALLSAGRIVDDSVECPYHGWRFGTEDGTCQQIPSLCADQDTDPSKIKVRTFPTREDGQLIWVYLSSNKKFSGEPTIDPPAFPFANRKPTIDDQLTLNCHVDHAVIGLMDPAHGPFVHENKWWRSRRSIHEKAKKFEPRERGFAMAAHSPSSNSLAYKLLGSKPITEITFRLPGIRTEEIKVGNKTLLSFTAVTPLDENRTQIRQVFFTDFMSVKLLKPFIASGARKFLRQDADMVDLQQKGLAYNPKLMLIEDADAQAKWYYAIKKEWAKSRAENREFMNPMKERVLRYRS